MTEHRRNVKARTRGPTHENPKHKRDVPPDTVSIISTHAGVSLPPGDSPCDAGNREDAG